MAWAELWARVERASVYFSSKLGTNRQEVVSILLTNSPEFVVTYLAILHAGHIALPLDPAYKKMELDAIIDQIPPKIIVTDERYADQIGYHKAQKLMVEEFMNFVGQPPKLLRLPANKQIASLTFTSGTTGKPKAVPNTHANHLWNIKVCSKVWQWTANDSLLLALPLSHWYGLVMGLSGVIYHGNTLYLRQQAFAAEEIMATLASGKVTIFTHVPLAYMKMLELKDSQYDLSKVRLLISGGAPLPPTVSREFNDRFGARIVETYGSSETGRIAANQLNERLVGSPGKLLPGVKAKISSEGELVVKSPGIFPGYYHNSPATKAGWTDEGWWRTGDFGEIKKRYVFLKGRLQERIRKFGYTISPRDVEWAMYHHPKIKTIYVMGRQRPAQPNDELVYFVVGDITRQEILDYCKTNLLFAWRPDRVIFIDAIPRTSNGKPKVSSLKQLVKAGGDD